MFGALEESLDCLAAVTALHTSTGIIPVATMRMPELDAQVNVYFVTSRLSIHMHLLMHL